MIKRRFYKQDHGDKSGSSDSSSSDDSDSAPEVEAEEDHQVEVHEHEGKGNDDGSGYESEDSSNNQDENDASGLLTNEEASVEEDLDYNKDKKSINKVPIHENVRVPEMAEITIDPNDPIHAEISNFILKCKSTFKCRLCPRILCLNQDTLKEHLNSKGHARSKKLRSDGRLKFMLNSDGEIEEEQETHAERHARTLALAQEPAILRTKKASGRQRQSHRRKKRMRSSNKGNPEASIENAVKKKRRSAD